PRRGRAPVGSPARLPARPATRPRAPRGRRSTCLPGSVPTLLRGSSSRLSASEEGATVGRVATILLVGVDLFFRGKLEGLLPEHRLVTSDSVHAPDVVIADISRVEPAEVVEQRRHAPIPR